MLWVFFRISLLLLRNALTFISALEALPLELQRNFTLMRELDGYAQGN